MTIQSVVALQMWHNQKRNRIQAKEIGQTGQEFMMHNTPIQAPRLGPMGNFMNGVIASSTMVAIMQPMFTVKTWILNGSGMPPTRNLYRGLGINMLSSAPGEGVTFATHYFAKQFFSSEGMTDMQNIAISAFSGMTGAVPFSICERIMIQQQVHGGSAMTAIRRTTAHEGLVRGVFKGLVPTLWRDSLFNCSIFALNEIAQRKLETLVPRKNLRELVVSFSVGGIVGAVTTPFDYAKTKMQADYLKIHTSCVKVLLESGGVRALYQGAGVRALLIGGCTYCVTKAKDVVPFYLPRDFHETI